MIFDPSFTQSTFRSIVLRLVLLFALLAGWIGWPRSIQANPTATITVNTVVDELNNDGDCSLREAIQAANTNAAVDACPAGSGTDTITFDPATNGNPFILTGAANEDANASGDLDILDGGDLTIQGNGVANTIIDGGSNDRVFHLCPGGGCANTITIDNVAIRSGSAVLAPSLTGGGVHNQDATLNLRNSRVGDSLASVGGGIYNIGGAVTVDNTHITANVATTGGGIHNQGTLDIQNGSVIGGTGAGTGNQATDGGGISNLNGTMTVDSSAVLSNIASEDGGGIWNNGTLDIQNSSGIGEAGAGNQATYGGGIYNGTDGVVTVDGSSVVSNSASEYGGGIWSQAIMYIGNDSDISSNTAKRGAGVFNDAGTVTLDGSAISSNIASSYGGGIYNDNEGSASITLSLLKANQADGYGGGIYNLKGTTTIISTTISMHTAEDGAGIYNYQGTTTVDASQVTANYATGDGGGIWSEAPLNVTNGSTISNNEATDGGGIYNNDQMLVDSSEIISNTAGDEGGGIYNDYDLDVKNSVVRANQAVEGGGIFNRGELTVTISIVETNTATGDGGGIQNERDALIDNSIVRYNTAALSGGGGVYNSRRLYVINLSTIQGNQADIGGGIYSEGSTLAITNTRILDNLATTNGGGIYSDRDNAQATDVTQSCIVGNSDMAFFNNQPSQQVATYNWWGVPSGPNMPGADTVSGNVDSSFFLTQPILDCASDLQVGKTNDTAGQGLVGQTFNWILTIQNLGLREAVFSDGQTILQDDLPASPTYGTPVVADLVNITNPANITCAITSGSLICQADGGDVNLGADSRFTVAIPVTPHQTGTLMNPVGICQADPDGEIPENVEDNNDCAPNQVDITATALAIYLPLVTH